MKSNLDLQQSNVNDTQFNYNPDVNNNYEYQEQFYFNPEDANQKGKTKKVIVSILLGILALVFISGATTFFIVNKMNKDNSIALYKKEGEEFVLAVKNITKSQENLADTLIKQGNEINLKESSTNAAIYSVISNCLEVSRSNFKGTEANVETEVELIKQNTATIFSDYKEWVELGIPDHKGEEIYLMFKELAKANAKVESAVNKL